MLEKHKLAEQILALPKAGTVVDATLIAAPSSNRNEEGQRDPEMHQCKKGSQKFFGMKAHIGVDAECGTVHTVRGTADNVNDLLEVNSLLHGQESDVFAEAVSMAQPSAPTPERV